MGKPELFYPKTGLPRPMTADDAIAILKATKKPKVKK